MTGKEIGTVFAFLCVVGLTAALEIRWLSHLWMHRRAASRPRFWPVRSARADKVLTLAINAAAIGGTLCILYGFLIEPTWIAVETVELYSDKISAESGRIRIVQLSDLHSETEPLNELDASEIIRTLKPDIIAVTGDFINDEAAVPLVRKTLEHLARTAPVFLVRGNYDIGFLPSDAFEGLPVTVLTKESVRELKIRGTLLRLTGLPVVEGAYFTLFSRKLEKKGAYDIFLHHYSDLVYEADKAGIDLYLSGHTHGGQVRLPFYGALVTLAKFGKRFEAGMYQVGGTVLYVNRGLGMEGGSAPRVRFLCRPEITVIDLFPGG